MRALAVALAFAALAVATACGASESSPEPTTTAETTTAAPDRAHAPELAGTTLDGDAIALGDFRGRPLMINVWSSW